MRGPERLTFRGYRGIELAADQWGSDVATRGIALFLPGGGQTRHSWARTARRLAAVGWTSISVDARGHGDSQWSPDGEYTLDMFVKDLLCVTRSLDRRPVVIGASLGGRTALVTEGEHPGATAGLVLVDIAPRVDPAGQARIREFMAAAPNGFGSLEEVAEAIDAYRPARRRPGNLQGLTKNVRQRADGRWYWHWDPGFLDYSADPRNFATDRIAGAAAGVRVPALVVRGNQSDLVTAEAADDLVRMMPEARLVEVAAGHMIAGDDNDVFTARLRDFLDEVAAGAAERDHAANSR